MQEEVNENEAGSSLDAVCVWKELIIDLEGVTDWEFVYLIANRFSMAWKNGIQVPFPLFFFAWHWKTDLNFVFRFSFSHHFKKRKRVSF